MRFLIKIWYLYLTLVVFCNCNNREKSQKKSQIQTYIPPVIQEIPKENYGFDLDKYTVVSDTVREDNTIGLIFGACELSYKELNNALISSKGIVDLRKIRPGSAYKFLFTKDSIPKIKSFIYEEDLLHYYIVYFDESSPTEKCSRNITLKKNIYKGVIENSLWETIQQEKIDSQLVYELASVFAWTVDFFRLYKGDRFKVILEERYINDTIYAGIERIDEGMFEHNNEDFYAFRYVDPKGKVNYYDNYGDSTKHTFLKAPIKYARITSRYSRRRFHPVLKRWKSHKGTDYGAPRGTPILVTADGTVIASRYSRFNGNYVKIRHDNSYKTQYLHMSRRVVKKGQRVKQGQIIGYVGSTGLATGPHVCYRFWKKGVQVDPYKQHLPKAKAIKPEYKEKYLKYIEPLKKGLDSIKF